MIDTVVFDLDGTLLDTLDDLTSSVNFALTSYGLSPIIRDETRHYLGNGTDYLIEKASGLDASDEKFAKIKDKFAGHYKNNCRVATRPYEGVQGLITKLREDGYKMAVVSNKLDGAVKTLRDEFFGGIDVAVGNTPEVKRKPAPDMVLAAVAEIKSDIVNCVYVGDSEVDLLTARNSGMRCISVSWGFRTKQELTDAGASLIVDTPVLLYDAIKMLG